MATAAGLAPLCCPAHTCIGYLVNAMSPTARLALTWSYPAGHMDSIAVRLGHTQRRAPGKANTSSSLLVQVQLHRLLLYSEGTRYIASGTLSCSCLPVRKLSGTLCCCLRTLSIHREELQSKHWSSLAMESAHALLRWQTTFLPFIYGRLIIMARTTHLNNDEQVCMSMQASDASDLQQFRGQRHTLQQENEELRRQLAAAQARLAAVEKGALQGSLSHTKDPAAPHPGWAGSQHNLSSSQISRYSRHLLLSSFGVAGQERLCNSSVLIIGAGGLGSPAALYLAAAGIGRLGLVDQDAVELSNLHRQICHTEARVGRHKADSAAEACCSLNSSIQVETHHVGLTASNALDLVSAYDVVVDCSDNAPTRYLASDACVVAGKPLVSGAAIGTDGQLSVYCHGEQGPCYRCLFPASPQAASCARCSDAGVLGVVPGVMGTLQALEAIKLAAGVGQVLSQRLLIFDALALRFQTVKLRGRQSSCVACGDSPSITAATLPHYDYAAFTGQPANDQGPPSLHVLPPNQRVTPAKLQRRLQAERPALVDVRPRPEFDMAHLPGSVNYPFDEMLIHLPHLVKRLKGTGSPQPHAVSGTVSDPGTQLPATASAAAPSVQAPEIAIGAAAPLDEVQPLCEGQAAHASALNEQASVVVLCRRGNDSQLVVQSLREHGLQAAVDLTGGLAAWAQHAGTDFPTY